MRGIWFAVAKARTACTNSSLIRCKSTGEGIVFPRCWVRKVTNWPGIWRVGT
jgi:hypothetical protein